MSGVVCVYVVCYQVLSVCGVLSGVVCVCGMLSSVVDVLLAVVYSVVSGVAWNSVCGALDCFLELCI